MDIISSFLEFIRSTGLFNMEYKIIVMLIIGLILIYLAIRKKYEPLLLLPIGFGIIIANMPLAEMGVHKAGGLMYYIYRGVTSDIYPPLIFLGLGALTDFYGVLARPKVILLGAAAQFGVFAALFFALLAGFGPKAAAAIGIIGGADGPTAVFLANKLSPDLLAPISIAAYSYIALVPIIQPPIIKLLTKKSERRIKMKPPRKVSQREKVLFPIVAAIVIILLAPKSAPLIGMIMLGNLLKESGVTGRLAETAGNALENIVTILLMLSIGASAKADTFLTFQTIKILLFGAFAFGISTATGVIFGKIMNYFSKESINPLIGAAGVSAVPASARVVQKIGREEDPSNSLLFHAMGPNISGVIGTATAAGVMLTILSP